MDAGDFWYYGLAGMVLTSAMLVCTPVLADRGQRAPLWWVFGVAFAVSALAFLYGVANK